MPLCQPDADMVLCAVAASGAASGGAVQLSSGGSVASRQMAACSGTWELRVRDSALGGRRML